MHLEWEWNDERAYMYNIILACLKLLLVFWYFGLRILMPYRYEVSSSWIEIFSIQNECKVLEIYSPPFGREWVFMSFNSRHELAKERIRWFSKYSNLNIFLSLFKLWVNWKLCLGLQLLIWVRLWHIFLNFFLKYSLRNYDLLFFIFYLKVINLFF